MEDNTFRIEVTDNNTRIVAWVKFEDCKWETNVFVLSNWSGKKWTVSNSMTYPSDNIQKAQLMHQAISAAFKKLANLEK